MPIIEHMTPVFDMPVGAPTSFAMLLPIMPRIKPGIPKKMPNPQTNINTRDTIPSTIDAICCPFPLNQSSFCVLIGGGGGGGG